MKISELEKRQSGVNITATIKEIEEPRSFDKFGKTVRVANAVIEDDSGTIKLTLWNEDIDKVKVGDKVRVTNGYVNEFQDEKQLTSGKFGKLEVNPSDDGEASEEAPQEEPKEE